MSFPRFGVPEVLELRDMPDPVPGPGEEVVKIEVAGVNFADIMTAQGGYPTAPPPPIIAGREFAGTLEGTGTPVMGYTQMGAFAERLAARSDLLWPQPAKWSVQEAAAFPVNYFTAYLAYWKAGLVNKPSTDEPVRVLIHAVAGGVGTARLFRSGRSWEWRCTELHPRMTSWLACNNSAYSMGLTTSNPTTKSQSKN